MNTNEMPPYETVNEILVRLFHDILDIEQKVLITGEFSNITYNDMHIIEAIGKDSSQNMSSVAKSLHITLGTLTTAIHSLVKKGYVVRGQCEQDRRVVLLALTESGKRAYDHHKAFHKSMVEAALKDLKPKEVQVLIQTLTTLKEHFTSYE